MNCYITEILNIEQLTSERSWGLKGKRKEHYKNIFIYFNFITTITTFFFFLVI